MSYIIPDTIEPWHGYKALIMIGDELHSPSFSAFWPHGKPLQADCTKKQREFTWELVDAPEGWGDTFYVPSGFLKEGANTTFSWPPSDPPKGQTWLPVDAPHKLTGCSCGIYAVDTTPQLGSYLQGTDRVIAHIAMWGEVIIGNKGARGQYAYPQKIWAAEQQAEQAQMIAEAYGIPVEIVVFEKKEKYDS